MCSDCCQITSLLHMLRFWHKDMHTFFGQIILILSFWIHKNLFLNRTSFFFLNILADIIILALEVVMTRLHIWAFSLTALKFSSCYSQQSTNKLNSKSYKKLPPKQPSWSLINWRKIKKISTTLDSRKPKTRNFLKNKHHSWFQEGDLPMSSKTTKLVFYRACLVQSNSYI